MSVTIVIPKEIKSGELRVAMTPNLVTKLIKLGATVKIQQNAGIGIHAQDAAYKDAEIIATTAALYAAGEVVLKVQPPTEDEVAQLKEGAIIISFRFNFQPRKA